MISYANDNKQQLKKLQQDLVKKEKSVQQQQQQRTTLLSKLKQQEQSICYSTRAWRNTRKTLNLLNRDIDRLSRSISKLQSDQAAQHKLLGQQLETVFRQGQYVWLQWVFSNHVERQRSERIRSYFLYLNKEREKKIQDLRQTSAKLTMQKIEQQQKKYQQNALLQQEDKLQRKLQSTRYHYQKTLISINSSITDNQESVIKWRQNEKRLRDTIARTERKVKIENEKQAKNILVARTDGLGLLARRQAMWPVRGHKLHSFGEPQLGDLRYKGLVIAAPEGSTVQAIAHGRVMMADWLQGYGLMVVIEHGKNYMSLYGYNQSTLVHVGDQVKAGQAIALVGSSNGGTPSLYFEIRRQGQAVNPIPWLGR
ncbi:peptidoglycan DD-metalloendopeptidase family protein [Candidatus Palibaumannia cicadellinicola]|nr:peptidoglycan DD-metalloendopeptidase family protein [Candidatus Baumannia cicadellinicola]